MRIVAVRAVTDDRGAGVALVRDAVVYAGEHRRYREIGIGVGTARAMLDVAARRRAGGDTEGYGAVVDPPGRRDGGVAVRFEAAVAVGVRREDRETVADAADHAADRVAQRGRSLGIVACKDVVARRGVEDRKS